MKDKKQGIIITTARKYPVGIRTFSEIIGGGCLYVDKTDLVWELAHYAKFVFLNRPRRFGKSLLSSTLESYFQGAQELFEGLKIMALEKDWKQHPVLHFDLSAAKRLPISGMMTELGNQVALYERIFGTICGITEQKLTDVFTDDVDSRWA